MNVRALSSKRKFSNSAQQALLDRLHAVQGAPAKGGDPRDAAGGQLNAGQIMECSRSERSGQDSPQHLFNSTAGEASGVFYLHTLSTFFSLAQLGLFFIRHIEGPSPDTK